MSAFPAHPDDITDDWWNAVLGRVPDRWRWEPIGTGQVGDSVRFTLDFADEQGVTLAGKFAAADPTSRMTAAMLGLYAKEVRFYRDLAPQLPIRTPRTFAAQMADFLFQPQRLNVAVTRPRSKLILVGSHHMLKADEIDPEHKETLDMLRDLVASCQIITVPNGDLS